MRDCDELGYFGKKVPSIGIMLNEIIPNHEKIMTRPESQENKKIKM
jgi:hypothetical protein